MAKNAAWKGAGTAGFVAITLGIVAENGFMPDVGPQTMLACNWIFGQVLQGTLQQSIRENLTVDATIGALKKGVGNALAIPLFPEDGEGLFMFFMAAFGLGEFVHMIVGRFQKALKNNGQG